MDADEEERVRREIAGAFVRRPADKSAPPALPPDEQGASLPMPFARWSAFRTHPLAIPAVVVVPVVATLLAVYAGTALIGGSKPSAPTTAPATTTAATPPATTAREQQRAAKEALIALRALESVTSVGATHAEYMRRLGDTKIKVDQVFEEIKDPESRAAIASAMRYYEGTAHVWEIKVLGAEKAGPDLLDYFAYSSRIASLLAT